MKDIHLVIQEIKDGYKALGLVYTHNDIIDVLVRYYGLKPHDIEELKL